MSVSEMNMSWSTASAQLSTKSLESSTFITAVSKDGKEVRRKPKCLSAKHSGMRFPGWKEPKPLRSRCGSASQANELDVKSFQRSAPKSRESKDGPVMSRSIRGEGPFVSRSVRSKGSLVSRSVRSGQLSHQDDVKHIVNRLSQPTLSSKVKGSVNRPREAGTDMNWYNWAKMNVYKDYQGVLYGKNGTMKTATRNRER